MQLTLRDGSPVNARFLMPTGQPAEAGLLGTTDQHDASSPEVFGFCLPIDRLKEIRFEA
ncbi:MAG: hypothetical protein ABSE93_25470 [Terriglobia bacterium]|jgi:hypothetical protein